MHLSQGDWPGPKAQWFSATAFPSVAPGAAELERLGLRVPGWAGRTVPSQSPRCLQLHLLPACSAHTNSRASSEDPAGPGSLLLRGVRK